MSTRGLKFFVYVAATLLLCSVGWLLWRSGTASVQIRSNAATAGSGSPVAAQPPETPPVRLQKLGGQRQAVDRLERNLFQFKSKPVKAGLVSKSPPPLTQPQPPGPPRQPAAPGITLKYIGFLERANGRPKVVGLLDPAGNVILCTEGEACDGRYRIWRVGVESLEISYLDGSSRRTIRQSGR